MKQATPSCCCSPPARPLRRLIEPIRWAAPGVILAIMPKCPVCLAAHLAFWTGIGLSATSAAYVRLTLLVLCPAYLAFLIATRVRRWLRPARC